MRISITAEQEKIISDAITKLSLCILDIYCTKKKKKEIRSNCNNKSCKRKALAWC